MRLIHSLWPLVWLVSYGIDAVYATDIDVCTQVTRDAVANGDFTDESAWTSTSTSDEYSIVTSGGANNGGYLEIPYSTSQNGFVLEQPISLREGPYYQFNMYANLFGEADSNGAYPYCEMDVYAVTEDSSRFVTYGYVWSADGSATGWDLIMGQWQSTTTEATLRLSITCSQASTSTLQISSVSFLGPEVVCTSQCAAATTTLTGELVQDGDFSDDESTVWRDMSRSTNLDLVDDNAPGGGQCVFVSGSNYNFYQLNQTIADAQVGQTYVASASWRLKAGEYDSDVAVSCSIDYRLSDDASGLLLDLFHDEVTLSSTDSGWMTANGSWDATVSDFQILVSVQCTTDDYTYLPDMEIANVHLGIPTVSCPVHTSSSAVVASSTPVRSSSAIHSSAAISSSAIVSPSCAVAAASSSPAASVLAVSSASILSSANVSPSRAIVPSSSPVSSAGTVSSAPVSSSPIASSSRIPVSPVSSAARPFSTPIRSPSAVVSRSRIAVSSISEGRTAFTPVTTPVVVPVSVPKFSSVVASSAPPLLPSAAVSSAPTEGKSTATPVVTPGFSNLPSNGLPVTSAVTRTVPSTDAATSISAGPHLTTSTVFATSTATITACPSTIPNCPVSKKTTYLTTETILVSTTICPVTATATVVDDGSYTSTILTTRTMTITSCAAKVTNCPARAQTTFISTQTLVAGTTVIPAKATLATAAVDRIPASATDSASRYTHTVLPEAGEDGVAGSRGGTGLANTISQYKAAATSSINGVVPSLETASVSTRPGAAVPDLTSSSRDGSTSSLNIGSGVESSSGSGSADHLSSESSSSSESSAGAGSVSGSIPGFTSDSSTSPSTGFFTGSSAGFASSSYASSSAGALSGSPSYSSDSVSDTSLGLSSSSSSSQSSSPVEGHSSRPAFDSAASTSSSHSSGTDSALASTSGSGPAPGSPSGFSPDTTSSPATSPTASTNPDSTLDLEPISNDAQSAASPSTLESESGVSATFTNASNSASTAQNVSNPMAPASMKGIETPVPSSVAAAYTSNPSKSPINSPAASSFATVKATAHTSAVQGSSSTGSAAGPIFTGAAASHREQIPVCGLLALVVGLGML